MGNHNGMNQIGEITETTERLPDNSELIKPETIIKN